jgi:hypothetical protein
MTNTTGYMGFQHIGFLPGYAPDYQLQAKMVVASNATAIYNGDPVTFASGYIIACDATASGTVNGIFQGCQYTDASGVTQWRPYVPAAQTATAYIINAPGALFKAQASNTAITQAQINSNVGFVVAAGQTTGGGFSGYTLDSGHIGTTATYPFRLVNLLSTQAPSGTNGTDNANPYNQAIITFNNVDYRAGQTGH